MSSFIYALIGTPKGFDCVLGGKDDVDGISSSIEGILDLDNSHIMAYPEGEIWCIKRRELAGKIYNFYILYRHAYEIGDNRLGSFYGAAIVMEGIYEPSLLRQALQDLADNLKNKALEGSKFIRTINEFKIADLTPKSVKDFFTLWSNNKQTSHPNHTSLSLEYTKGDFIKANGIQNQYELWDHFALPNTPISFNNLYISASDEIEDIAKKTNNKYKKIQFSNNTILPKPDNVSKDNTIKDSANDNNTVTQPKDTYNTGVNDTIAEVNKILHEFKGTEPITKIEELQDRILKIIKKNEQEYQSHTINDVIEQGYNDGKNNTKDNQYKRDNNYKKGYQKGEQYRKGYKDAQNGKTMKLTDPEYVKGYRKRKEEENKQPINAYDIGYKDAKEGNKKITTFDDKAYQQEYENGYTFGTEYKHGYNDGIRDGQISKRTDDTNKHQEYNKGYNEGYNEGIVIYRKLKRQKTIKNIKKAGLWIAILLMLGVALVLLWQYLCNPKKGESKQEKKKTEEKKKEQEKSNKPNPEEEVGVTFTWKGKSSASEKIAEIFNNPNGLMYGNTTTTKHTFRVGDKTGDPIDWTKPPSPKTIIYVKVKRKELRDSTRTKYD